MAEVDLDEAAGRVLVDAALAAAGNAHAPYSRFAVGAALLLSDGSIVSGCNVENASYGLSLCAETVAVAAATVAGRLRDVVAVAVVGGTRTVRGIEGDTPVYPCGRCRQVLNEAADLGQRDLLVFCASADGSVLRRHRLSELLPHAFGPGDLGLR